MQRPRFVHPIHRVVGMLPEVGTGPEEQPVRVVARKSCPRNEWTVQHGAEDLSSRDPVECGVFGRDAWSNWPGMAPRITLFLTGHVIQ